MMPSSLPEPFLRPPISSSQVKSQDSLLSHSSPHGTTSTKTTRDGSDTRRLTPSKDSSTVPLTSSRTPQAPLWTCPQEELPTHFHTHKDQSKLQSVKYDH